MNATAFDWTYFIKKVYIEKPLNELFRMWVHPGNITKFWLSGARYFVDRSQEKELDYPQSNCSYEWKFHSGLTMRGTILDIRENQLFKFTFGDRYEGSEEKVIVSIAFKDEEDGRSAIELIQENIGEDERGRVYYYVSCQLGWQFALTNLKSVMEKGNDLREKDLIRSKETVGISLDRQNSVFK